VKYYYVKQCKCCGGMYYRKEINEEQFSILEENDNISIGCMNSEWEACIFNCCSECAEELYKEAI
jgi:hypothetical protein